MIALRLFLALCLALPLAAGAALLAPAPAAQSAFDAVDPDDPSPFSDAALVTEVATVAPGTSFDVALVLTQEPGWHSYWLNGGDAGQPTTITWTPVPGVQISDLRFPYPEAYDLAGLVSYGYEDEVTLLATVTVTEDYNALRLPLAATADWLICADICLTATADLSLTLPVGRETVRDAEGAAAVERARGLLPVRAAGWTVEALEGAEGFALKIMPPVDWDGSLEGAHFFPETTGVIDYAAPQPVSREGDAWTLGLAGSGIAETPDVLEGVLVAPEPETVDGQARALAVRAPVVPAGAAALGAGGGTGPVSSLWLALLLALGGGALLNLMPCVFPVLGIKILGFAEGRGHAPEVMRPVMRRHGLLFAAGVLVSFAVLAGALLALRAGGEAIGWGFQLQSPGVIAALAFLMTGIGLWLLGVVEFGGRLMGVAAGADRGTGARGALFSGVLATLVATPCSAPLMAPALGWALVQPPGAAVAVFLALGLGMALPYVLLSFFPAWLERLPRPGPWMETLKQALAFPMFLTAAWLVWTFGTQTGINGAGALLVGLVLLGVAAWVIGRWPVASGAVRVATRGIALAAVAGAVAVAAVGARQEAAAGAAEDDLWRAYSPEAVESLVAAGEPVFVDFTASWCATCQWNKGTVLRTDAIEAAFQERGVHLFVADWTRQDPEITATLESLDRAGVPVYALYPGGASRPVLLPEILSDGVVMDALDALSSPTASL